MTDIVVRSVSYTDSARAEMNALPCEIRQHLAWIIRCKAQQPKLQMVVTGWTICIPDHIYRAIKDYRYPPGYRVIFHCIQAGIMVDRIARRDKNPYLDFG